MTLAPIYPLEGSTDIYREFATGPFIWRAANLLSADQRRAVGAVAGPDLGDNLREKPSEGVLVGFEGGLAFSGARAAF